MVPRGRQGVLYDRTAAASRLMAVVGMLVGMVVMPGVAVAYQFVPTDLEWAAWPPYCKARYVSIPFGEATKFAKQYPRGEAVAWEKTLGLGTFQAIHHYCAGIAWLSRARLEQDEKLRLFALSNAKEECAFTYDRSDPKSPVFPNISVAIAEATYRLGEHEEARAFLETAIKEQPDRSEPYTALALFYRSESRRDSALEILRQGDNATDGKSAEIKYNLGLISLEAGDVDSAVTYAARAYDLGYPLPGLRYKLEKLGRWPD